VNETREEPPRHSARGRRRANVVERAKEPTVAGRHRHYVPKAGLRVTPKGIFAGSAAARLRLVHAFKAETSQPADVPFH
jgi:ribosomal protein L15E